MSKKKTGKPYDAQFRKYVRHLCSELRIKFFAGEYNLDVCWCEDAPLAPGEVVDPTKIVLATITLNPTYLDCTVHVHKAVWELWKEDNLREVARVLTHEFAHILIDPVYFEGAKGISKDRDELYNEIRERQVQRAANVVFDLLPEKFWNNKNGYASIKNKRRRK